MSTRTYFTLLDLLILVLLLTTCGTDETLNRPLDRHPDDILEQKAEVCPWNCYTREECDDL